MRLTHLDDKQHSRASKTSINNAQVRCLLYDVCMLVLALFSVRHIDMWKHTSQSACMHIKIQGVESHSNRNRNRRKKRRR
ncbi:hypothetical protein TPS_09347 [Trichinella pseudospiralis]